MNSTERAGQVKGGLRTLLAILFGLAAVLCTVTGCTSPSDNPTVDIDFVLPAGESGPSFEVEVVATDATRARGLMFRRELAERKGMLFIFPFEKIHSFWMKNTLIPLDMVFVSKEMKVVGILENVPPLTEDSRYVDSPSLYVLEFGGGVMKKLGVSVGSTLHIRGVLPKGL